MEIKTTTKETETMDTQTTETETETKIETVARIIAGRLIKRLTEADRARIARVGNADEYRRELYFRGEWTAEERASIVRRVEIAVLGYATA